MIEKLDEEYYESQTKLNLSEFFSNDEVQLLRKSIPDLSNIIYLISNIDHHNNTENSRTINDKGYYQQRQYRYFSAIRKSRNNSNSSFCIDKEKFYTIILDSIRQIFEKEKNYILSKSLSIIMDEILNISKIIKQNLVYYKFFKSIKNTKLNEIKKTKKSLSQSKIKVNCNSIEKNNSKYFTQNNIYNNDIIKIDNSNEKVKKHLSFETENENDKKNKKKFSSKSVSNLPKKDKEKNIKADSKDSSEIKPGSKKSPSFIYMKSKSKINLNQMKANKNNNRNLSAINISANQKKIGKKISNNLFLGSNKISLKKANKNYKKIGLYDFTHKNGNNLFKKSKEKSNKEHMKKINTRTIPPSSIDPKLYENIETQEFNIFKLESDIGRENVLPLIGYYVYKFFGFEEIINNNKFENWCQKIADGYIRKNFYHNDLHASDITQTCLLYFKMGEFETVHKFTKSNICSLFLSCMCHDYQHPGVNNNFLKETNNKIAVRYNDISILENMHIAKTFKIILTNKECNVFENVDKNLYKEMRKEMISCVLATDMAFHNIYVDFLKQCVNEKKEGIKESDDKKQKEERNQKYMNVLIHSADISNPTKLFDIYFEWAKLVVEEFWDQGDKEKKLNLPCFCDREKVTIYQSQLGFINFIEIPYFSLLADLNPKLKFFYDNLLNNKNILLSLQEKDKEKKEKEKEKEKEKGKEKEKNE